MIISLNNITKIYGKDMAKLIALDNISLDINEGEFIGVMGPSGCGKSTLLNIVGAVDLPTNGEYKLKDIIINKKNINNLSKIRNKEIAFIFQNFALIKDYTVFENVTLPLKFRKVNKKEKNIIADKYLKELGILEYKNKLVSELSGGQQQRVAICRALVQESDLILADEPTGALDQKNGMNIMEILKMLNKKYNKTIIIVTHDDKIASYCDRIIYMKDGKII
ncbi:ABC transporter ATP-binding protein [Clostridium sardiniense]|uniref:ABC transporter ATP-binding protein n=1 Tax=Clostridium sardiniense TaxID=29369 RepID=UPI0019573E04|nr:ABC transporter ATP-binding protein [Clostridium sardiniense]MBM7836521.1 putative ABC transport system ATP-binding protein [Clostridium sardiniense]